MFDVGQRVRRELLLAAILWGGGLGLLAATYFAALGAMPGIISSVLFQGAGIGWHLKVKRRPPWWQLAGVGLASFVVVLGLFWAIAPSASNLRLGTYNLPNGHIDTPVDGDETESHSIHSKQRGRYAITTDSPRLRVVVRWRDDSTMPARADLARIRDVVGLPARASVESIDDRELTLAAPHQSYAVVLDGVDGRVTLYTCATYLFSVLTLGHDAPALHRRVVDTAACDPFP